MADDTQSPLYSLQNILIDSGNLILGNFLGHGASGVIYQATSLQKWQRSSSLISHSAASPVLAIRRLQKKKPPAPPVTKVHYAVKAVFSSTGEMEANLHSRASGHRGILALHRVIREGAFIYFVLDLCPSGDLFEAVSRRLYFRNVQDIKSIFLQLIDAVEHCHSLGIFHRDLKLENILLKNEEGEPPHIVLSDFGLATEEIRTRDRTGSQMYMSPESLGRYGSAIEDYDCAANDVWAMGIILVILILGNCAPWAMASDTCPVFHNYTHNTRDFFARRHGMTAETNALMTRIFVLNPPARISLRDLRPTIHALNEFTAVAVQGEHDLAVLSSPLGEQVDLISPLYRDKSSSSEPSLNLSISPVVPSTSSPLFNPFALRSSVTESFNLVSGPEISPIPPYILLPEAQDDNDMPPIYEEAAEPSHPSICTSDADADDYDYDYDDDGFSTIDSNNQLCLSLGPAETSETVLTTANHLALKTGPPPAYQEQEMAQAPSPPVSPWDTITSHSHYLTPPHHAFVHLQSPTNKINNANRSGRSVRFTGHGPSPLCQTTSLYRPSPTSNNSSSSNSSNSSSSSSSSSTHSSSTSTSTASSLSDYGDETDFPITPFMGLIDDGVIGKSQQDDDDDSRFAISTTELTMGRYIANKRAPLEPARGYGYTHNPPPLPHSAAHQAIGDS